MRTRVVLFPRSQGDGLVIGPQLGMTEFLTTSAARVVLSLTALAILIAIGYYIVRKVRDSIDEEDPTANDWLAEFRRLHRSGKMSEFEFRRVKKTLGEQLRQETLGRDARDSSGDG